MADDCLYPPGEYLLAGRWHKLACKTWRCPHCREILKNRLLDRISLNFTGFRARFVTLTLQSDFYFSTRMSITKCWNRLKAYLYKLGYKNFRYVWVKEFTQNGVPHLHLLISVFIPIHILKRAWLYATDGTSYIVHISRVRNMRNAAGYVSKYLVKALFSYNFEKGERRFSFSRNTLKFKNEYMQHVSGIPVRVPGQFLNVYSNHFSELLNIADKYSLVYYNNATCNVWYKLYYYEFYNDEFDDLLNLTSGYIKLKKYYGML